MTVSITLNSDTIHQLDLTPVKEHVDLWLESGAIATHASDIQFDLDYPREPTDPREISEVPEIRLWFICLDAYYPWMPYLLDWEAGELSRYAAMLIPHQFSRSEGIQYNPEALEIFVMQKVFVLVAWMQKHEISGRNRLKQMTTMLGYELDDSFFDLIKM
ncbi:MAG: CRR6 family NdhI maturation factor [Elainellaceae cyanobacterium]